MIAHAILDDISIVYVPETTYTVWGLDLSRTLQGAGGIGGLLAEITPDEVRYPFCDGNGNITDWVDSDGEMIAHYEYDPYGNEMTGNPPTSYGFSSKPFDSTLGLYYYGYRFYRPDWGRWINRDPIGEESFRVFREQVLKQYGLAKMEEDVTVYQFVINDPENAYDILGLACDPKDISECWTDPVEAACCGLKRFRKWCCEKGAQAMMKNLVARIGACAMAHTKCEVCCGSFADRASDAAFAACVGNCAARKVLCTGGVDLSL